MNTSLTAARCALLLGSALVVPTAHALDCGVRESEFGNPTWSCQSATQLMQDNFMASGQLCIPAADFASWGCLELDGDARLCNDGVYNMSVYLAHDHASLDCAGATLAPRGGSIGNSARSALRTPYTHSVGDITVRDCQIDQSPGYGIDLKRFFRADEPCLSANGDYAFNVSSSPGCTQALDGHHDIHLSGIGISSPNQIGIYVGQSSRDVDITDVDIDGAFLGVYIEASASETHISRAVITNSADREGIAVDSAHHNVIEDSVFEGNGPDILTAINLYKNAGEYHGQVCPVRRPWGADYNTIRRNHFYDDDVNVASRESQDRYVLCGVYAECQLNYRDHANHTVVVDNVFHHGAQLDLLDDTYIVHGNHFESNAELELGAKQHEYTLHGVVAHNSFDTGANIRKNASNFSDLSVYNNVNQAGACSASLVGSLNVCGAPNTTVWVDKVVSAGLWAVVL